jgi:putative membrane protein
MSHLPYRAFLAVVALATAVTALPPVDYAVWIFELSIGLAAAAALVATRRRFPFSSLVYILASIHFVVLAVGAHWTYAEAPPGYWLKDLLGLSRNPFDRVGHFMQGFVPAIVVREILLRTTGLRRGPMLGFLCIAVCLAFSAFYELIEWWIVVLFYPQSGPEWLGMQGDPWDAQGDMLMCLIGATLAVPGLSALHNRSMAARESAAAGNEEAGNTTREASNT